MRFQRHISYNMSRICLLLLTVACAWAVPAPSDLPLHKLYDTDARINQDGFPAESHHVITSDGYVLEINRIPHGRHDQGGDRPVVFLMHGLTASAVSYFMVGPEISPAYNLADAGFDVWMGNARGVLNSRNHVSMDADADRLKFFDFTFEHIALDDLPTMIDYVLEYTGKEKLHYVGHSQGGTVFLILNSMKPEYNAKFESVHLLAGVGYQNHFPTAALRIAAISTDLIYAISTNHGLIEVFGPEWNEIGECIDDTGCEVNMVHELVTQLYGDLEVYTGASLKQFAHYGQNIRDRKFRRWNYGLLNVMHYGRITPPEYNLGLITANVTMHYTINDALLDEKDVLDMARDMPNTSVRKVARDDFLHTEFTVAPDVKELVTDYIIEELKSHY